jgi:UV radiation resistance-associated gene protein
MRRRSTLHWSTTSPRVRQTKLEDMVATRLADTWVSVHCAGVPEPVYISEVIERSMNPSFAFFDLDSIGPQVSRSDECTIRVWARDSKSENYCLLVEVELNLRSLQFIGRNLENFHHPLPQNCILLHLSDGIYTSFTDLPAEPHPNAAHAVDHKAGSSKPGSTFDALMQLANLDECIQDAVKVRSQLEDDINRILTEAHVLTVEDEAEPELGDENPRVKAALAAEQKHLRQLTRRREDLENSLARRREALLLGRDVQTKSQALIETRNQECDGLEGQIKRLDTDRVGQVRRICESLLAIFPIEPVKNRTLQFTIRGIHLPNSVYNDTNRDEIAAALGFTAQLVHQLALYLSTTLPYSLEPSASTSYVSDPISIGLSQRRYPLYPITVPYKFEYGVFLLNKDIEFLMNRQGLRVLDIRHTLPNLKYLLFVLTAGTGEMPARKAGGVRGLLGRMNPGMLRRTSEDSVRSTSTSIHGDLVRAKMNGTVIDDKEKEADPFLSTSPPSGLPTRFGTSRTMPK